MGKRERKRGGKLKTKNRKQKEDSRFRPIWGKPKKIENKKETQIRELPWYLA